MQLVWIFILLVSLPAFSLSIISDLDDTIKVTHVKSPVQAARYAVSSTKAYEPMPLLLNEMGQYTNDLILVSASPKLFTRFIQKFISDNNLQVKEVYTRKLRDLGNKEQFKINTIQSILDRSQEEFILIGDNSELDSKVYAYIKQHNPDRIREIYIHEVYADEIPNDQKRFYTAFDIAVSEYAAGRMSFEQVSDIAKKIIMEKQMTNIIPSFAVCPTKNSQFNSVSLGRLTLLATTIKTKIIGYCKLRERGLN